MNYREKKTVLTEYKR